MHTSGPIDRPSIAGRLARALLGLVPGRRATGSMAAVLLLCVSDRPGVWAQQPDWKIQPVQALLDEQVEQHAPLGFGYMEQSGAAEYGASFVWQDADRDRYRTVDYSVAPADFPQPDAEEPPPDISAPGPGDPDWSVTDELERLNQRLNELETARLAQEDATRNIIRRSFAERGSNITDAVVFGGTLETLTFWADDFDGVAESDIILDTAELDFAIQVNPWTLGVIFLEYDSGTNFLFPTTEGDPAAVDRINVRDAFITVGDTANYPLFATFGRLFVPFGISTGDPVADVLTIIDPLTVEVFETREDVMMFGFEAPTCCPPPASPNPVPPPPPVRPVLINPLVRRVATSLVSYCPCTPPAPPPVPVAPLPTCTPPFIGAIYFYNGDTIDGIDEENHIEHMGGTLGYRKKGLYPTYCIPWSVEAHVDVNSSVFDSEFLQFEYRSFLPEIGFVPGMAAHVRSSYGPVAMVVEWNGAINNATFDDDLGTPINITPEAWQVSFAYQFDWNPYLEVIGAQGTYFTMGYSESQDLAGVTRVVGADAFRVGNVPERRLSVGMGEWVLDGLRVAFEYSHAWDYDVGVGTGNSADGVFMQLTYEW